ncbi:hypothetical protein FDC22_06025 [Clostridium botulinum]|nr:hypothetical protein [Clostridium botulinum]NFD81637.1 hypothetical protein [Clostridium botulinum]NFD90038.1 hypothetical protein [Clostridium botulinum]NFE19460.1 hypothetical protein [Clostridium botulinum]NFG43535.1 hypothetical protein [Clostridium botulinum]
MSHSKDKTLPWSWLFYIGKVQLGFSEREFWKLTLRKLLLTWEEHCKFNGWTKKEEKEREDDVYIDQCSWL